MNKERVKVCWDDMRVGFIRLVVAGLLCLAVNTGLFVQGISAQDLNDNAIVRGVVTNAADDSPVEMVHVINKRSGQIAFTNYQGEFEVSIREGDSLALAKEGFLSLNIFPRDPEATLRIQLHEKNSPDIELLPQVTVYGQSYIADSLQLRGEYRRFFPSPPPTLKDAVTSNGTLDLNAFIGQMMTPWDREFSERLLAYEQKKYIDKVFTTEKVKQVVDVPSKDLEEFMRVSRPSYSFLLTANEYELIKYIRDAYRLYRRAKYGETLPGGRSGSIIDR